MARKTFELLGYSKVDPADYSNRTVWRSIALSDVNTKLNASNGIPQNAKITSAKIKVKADMDGTFATDDSAAYIAFGFGSESQISTSLMGDTRIKKSSQEFPNSTGVEIKDYFSSLIPPFSINTGSYGSRFVTRMKTQNILISNFIMDWANLIVTYETINYTIKFNANGGSGTMSDLAMTYNTAKNLTANAFTRTGYTFLGWSTSSSATTATYKDKQSVNNLTTTVGATINLYAIWKANTYTVTYNGNGATSGSTNSSSHTYDVGKNLTANGYNRIYTVTYNYNGNGQSNTTATATYTFKNWNKNSGGTSTSYSNKQSVANLTSTNNGTVTLYAQWNSASVTLPKPTRTGYTFNGWYTASSGGTKIGDGGASYTPTANITLHAQWTSHYILFKYYANNGETTEFTTWKAMASDSWPDNHWNYVNTDSATNKKTKVGYSPRPYTDSKNKISAGSYGKTIDGKSGFVVGEDEVFSDYSTLCSRHDTNASKTSDEISIYALWDANEYTITQVPNNGQASSQRKVTFDQQYGDFPSLTKTGYDFSGWWTAESGGVQISSTTNVTTPNDHTIYARWTKRKYKIKYEGNGSTHGSMNTSEHEYDTLSYLTTNTFERKYVVTYKYMDNITSDTIDTAHYVFNGWSGHGFSFSNGQSITNTLKPSVNNETFTLQAQWNSVSVTLPTPTRTGYTFAGWWTAATGGTQVGDSNKKFTPTANINLYAHWNPNPYTINFDATIGTVSTTQKRVVFDAAYGELPNPIKAGYYFRGWYTEKEGGQLINKDTIVKIAANHTLYAHWYAIPDINYDNLFSLSNWTNSPSAKLGGEANSNDSMDIDIVNGTVRIIEGDSSAIDVYTTYGGKNGHYNILVKPNTTYHIHLTMTQDSYGLGQFFVFYYKENGNASSIKTHTGWRSNTLNMEGDYKFDFTTPSDCYKIGLRFGTYSYRADVTFSNIGIYEDTLIYQKLIKEIPNYAIRDLQTVSQLFSPKKDGHTFQGWFSDESLTSTFSIEDAKKIEQGITVYSNWLFHKYYVFFHGNGADEGTSTETMELLFEEEVPLSKNGFTRVGYTYLGWSTVPDGEIVYIDEAPISKLIEGNGGKIDLYAKWQQNFYDVHWEYTDGKDGTRETYPQMPGGEIPIYNGTPTKDLNTEGHYIFNGWEPELRPLGEEITYTALFRFEPHDYEHIVIEPEGTSKMGYTIHKCKYEDCQYQYIDTYVWGVIFLDGDGSILEDNRVEPGALPICSSIPKWEQNERYYYTFNTEMPWTPPIVKTPLTEDDEHGVPNIGNVTYTPNYKQHYRYYDIIFQNSDGSENSRQSLKYKDRITPPKELDEDNFILDYTFEGWQNENNENDWIVKDSYDRWWRKTRENVNEDWHYEEPLVLENTIYNAMYDNGVKQKYFVEWWYEDEKTSTLLYKQEYSYGEIPEYPKDYGEPTKESDAQHHYKFMGWKDAKYPDSGVIEGELPEVNGYTIYIAQFSDSNREYEIRWVNASEEGQSGVEGELLYTEKIYFGETPTFDITKCITPREELKHPNQDISKLYEYVFIGWRARITDEPEDENLKFQGEVTYTAVYQRKYKEYYITIHRFIEDKYGPPETYVRHWGDYLYPNAMLKNIKGHTFSHWSDAQHNGKVLSTDEIFSIEVQGSAEYWAIYNINKYQVQWLDYDRMSIEGVEPVEFEYKSQPLLSDKKPDGPHKNYDDNYHYKFDDWYAWQGKVTEQGEILSDIIYLPRYHKIPHEWKVLEPRFNDDYSQCTAERECFVEDEYHNEKETVITTPTVLPGNETTCTSMGTTTYIANFKNNWSKTNPPPMRHKINIPTKPHEIRARKLGKDVKDGQHYVYCLNCDYEDIKGHDWDEGKVTSLSSCLNGGKMKFSCLAKGCDGCYYTDIAKDKHSFIFFERTEPTCTEPGNNPYKKCEKCNLYFSPNASEFSSGGGFYNPYIIDAKGHDMILIATKDGQKAGCDKDGMGIYECQRENHGEKCGTIEEKIIKARGHNWSPWNIELQPSCTSKGERKRICSNTEKDNPFYEPCDIITETEILKEIPHSPKINPGQPPTCTEKGISDETVCSMCNKILKNKYEIPPLGHHYAAKVLVPPENTLRREIFYGCIRKDCEHGYHVYFVE